MQLDLLKKIRTRLMQYTVKVPIIDPNTLKQKVDSNGKLVFEDRRVPLYVRLDNEHGIEETISELIWHDEDGYLEWFETPTRGNVSTIPMSGNTAVVTPVMTSVADYDQIQQISVFYNKEQYTAHMDTLITEGKITAEQKELFIQHWFNRTDQIWMIDEKDNKLQAQEKTFGEYQWPAGSKPNS